MCILSLEKKNAGFDLTTLYIYIYIYIYGNGTIQRRRLSAAGRSATADSAPPIQLGRFSASQFSDGRFSASLMTLI
ncbi:Hypothetical protein FKW44_019582 [Caligus rogercresseyi]|uniref:Uncharacterized protein n=1 Tax=Caligus rogercresseyi TaxID=217165 RepID=A0A7T8GWL1_CALRO|nr:Hypothetical protein FKW44_019582 [Caligus rogercresseyi]